MSKKDTAEAINLVKKLANDIKNGMNEASSYATDSEMQADLMKIMDKHYVPHAKKTARQNLIAYITQYISALPPMETIKRHGLYKSFIDSLHLVGEIFTGKINKSDNTQGGNLTALRKAITAKFGDEASQLFTESKISDSKRTVRRKANESNKRVAKHREPLKVSLEEIKACIERLNADLDSDDIKLQNIILLLSELAFGSRVMEVARDSEYKIMKHNDEDIVVDDTRRLTRSMRQKLNMDKAEVKNVQYIRQTGVLKKKNDKETATITKPVLPLINGKTTLDRLYKWRKDLAKRWESKGIERDDDKNQYGTIKTNNNILLREKYLIIKGVDPKTITSHILRKLYGVIGYYLLDGKYKGSQMTLQGYLKEVLGHTSLQTGEHYSHIILVNDKTRELIKIDDNAEEITKLREENEILRKENERLKKQLEILANK